MSSETRRDFANLDFLYDASAALLNLVPDKDGFVKISAQRPRRARHDPRAGRRSGEHHGPLDQPAGTEGRFRRSAPAQRPRSQEPFHSAKTSECAAKPGQPFVLADAAASRFEVYDSLAKVYGLMQRCRTIRNWPSSRSF